MLNQSITRSCPQCGTALTRRTQTKFCSTDCKKASQIRPLHDRLWDLIQKTDPCWLWSGPVINSGYGHISERLGPGVKRALKTHRLAWEEASGEPVPDGFMVLHTCDVRACCRNDEPGTYEANGVLHPRFGHLWIGTHEDNMADMTEKGRQATEGRSGHFTHPDAWPRGEQVHTSKLTTGQVRDIRRRAAYGGVTIRGLAREYEVAPVMIRRIIRRESWRHVA